MFRGLWALYIHSNVSLSPGPLRFAPPPLIQALSALAGMGGTPCARHGKRTKVPDPICLLRIA
jgi:hypothetical protein